MWLLETAPGRDTNLPLETRRPREDRAGAVRATIDVRWRTEPGVCRAILTQAHPCGASMSQAVRAAAAYLGRPWPGRFSQPGQRPCSTTQGLLCHLGLPSAWPCVDRCPERGLPPQGGELLPVGCTVGSAKLPGPRDPLEPASNSAHCQAVWAGGSHLGSWTAHSSPVRPEQLPLPCVGEDRVGALWLSPHSGTTVQASVVGH